MTKPLPNQTLPAFDVRTPAGGTFTPGDNQPAKFTLLLFYRGYHCPICKKQLEELNAKIGDFRDRGVEPVAISMDSDARARKSRDEWDIGELTVGFGLSESDARRIGLYLSSKRPDSEEPELFSEPATFLLRPDGRIFFLSVQSGPFARPPLDDLLQAIDFVVEKDYPARGDMTRADEPA